MDSGPVSHGVLRRTTGVGGRYYVFSGGIPCMASPRVLLKSAVFTVVVPGIVAGLIPQRLARRDSPVLPVDPRVSRSVGLISLLAGVGLYLHTAWRFADEGEGTPAPVDEPESLVSGGVYSYVRNPMYIGVILIVLGQALRYRSPHVLWWAVGCWLGFHHRVVDWEEPHLREKHGAAYDRYCEDVPRWIPRPWNDPGRDAALENP